MTKNSIALIGFMATGKSTIGKALVRYLGEDYKFIETDQIVVQKAGKSISRIFDEDGEDKFREYEALVCEEASKLSKIVVSCGGGAVLNKNNITYFKRNCFLVLLKTTSEEIYLRILENGKETRPIINKGNLKIEIERILKFRKPYYESAADIIIETTDKKIKKIIKEILFKTNLKA